MRRLIVAVALTSMFALAFAASAASAATMPAEGLFEDCPLDNAMTTCLQRLEVMHAGGASVVVIPVDETSMSSLSTYANAAHSLGMGVMWALSDQGWWQDPRTSSTMVGRYQAFSDACGCNQNGEILAYMVHWLGGLGGTYGYYAADDSVLPSGAASTLASYVAVIRQQDPGHMVMLGSANNDQTSTYEGMSDEIGQEIYPVFNGSLMPVSGNQDVWGPVADEISQTQRIATRDGKQSAFILQAFTWGDNITDGQATGVCTPSDTQASCYARLRYPSAAEQLSLRNLVLAHAHPKLILWWSFQGTYGQAGNDTYSVFPTGSVAAARWAGLEAAMTAPYPSSAASGSAPTATVASTGSTHHAASRRHRKHRRHRVHSRRHAHRHATRHGRRLNGRRPNRHHRSRRHPQFLAHAA
jgi:hypothetical protein